LFEYDGASRLKKQCWTATTCTAAGQTTWAYDALGRRTSEKIGSALATTYAYDAADQIVSTTQGTVVKSFAYNANGDQTVAPGMVSTFNSAHQTVSVAAPGGTVTYGYDGNGNRTSSTVGGVTTRFDWDNIGSGLPNVTAESVAGTVIRKYAYGHDMARTTNGTTNSFVLADPVGTITHLVSGAGVVQAQYLTGAYGGNKATTVTDPAVASNPIRYTGQYTDPTTGNIHLRARQYNPGLGMFTQTDPMPMSGGSFEASYAYGRNNPAMFTDPSGLRAHAASSNIPNQLALACPAGACAPPAPINWGGGISGGIPNVGGAVGRAFAAAIATASVVAIAKVIPKAVPKRTDPVHHVCAQWAKQAAPCRAILAAATLHVDDDENLVPLPASYHERLHTNTYFFYVNLYLQATLNITGLKGPTSRGVVVKALDQLKVYLVAGMF
jgi:RHS repeat-associated protein